MKISNIIALTCIAVVGYMTYAMQPTERGESSAMAAARGEEQNIPTLQQLSMTRIAKGLHDGEMRIDVTGMPKYPQERMAVLDRFFPDHVKAIAEAYYRLYPEEFPTTQTQKIPGIAVFLARLSDGSFIVTIDDYRAFCIVQRWRLQSDGTFVSSEELKVARSDLSNDSMAVSLDGNIMCLGPKLPMPIYARDSLGKFQRVQAISGDTDWLGEISCCAVYSDTVSKTLAVCYYSTTRKQNLLDIYDWNPELNRFEKLQEMFERAWDVQFIDNNCFIAAAWDRVTVWARKTIGETFTLRETLFTGEIEKRGPAALSLNKRIFVWGMERDKRERIAILERDTQNHFTPKQEITGPEWYGSNSLYLSSNGRRLIMTYDTNVNIWISDSKGHFSRKDRVSIAAGGFTQTILAGEQENYLVVCGHDSAIYKVYPSLDDIWNHILERQQALQHIGKAKTL